MSGVLGLTLFMHRAALSAPRNGCERVTAAYISVCRFAQPIREHVKVSSNADASRIGTRMDLSNGSGSY